MAFKLGLVFSKPADMADPFEPLGEKRPVYEDFMERCEKAGLEPFVVTTKTYEGSGLFKGYWKVTGRRKIEFHNQTVKVDVAYDRSGGLKFPPEDDNLRVVDNREFKILCWNKWKAYQAIGQYMPRTWWVGERKNLEKVLGESKLSFVVLKPYDGLKGMGVFIGTSKDALDFKFLDTKPNYILQEFVETSGGIAGLTPGRHDLRVVIINGKIVWSHIRTPLRGTYKANVARGGHLREITIKDIPGTVRKSALEIAKDFTERYDKPVFSLDFGIGQDGSPKVFEVNDQIGFPREFMQSKDVFLDELVKNLKSKI